MVGQAEAQTRLPRLSGSYGGQGTKRERNFSFVPRIFGTNEILSIAFSDWG
jgi:hypothetical protein